MDLLLSRILELGARAARPGEFTERAFLNGKLDLTQAEAVADLIESTTAAAARMASRTMQGVFSRRVDALIAGLVRLRTFLEAAIDFPDEEIDFIADSKVRSDLQALIGSTEALMTSAQSHGRAFGFDLDSSYAWIKGGHASKQAFCHSGYTGTSVVCDPTSGVYVIILTNRAHPNDKGTVKAVRKGVADIVYQAFAPSTGQDREDHDG